MSVGTGRDVPDVQYADHEFQTIRMVAVEPQGDVGGQASDREYEPLGGDLQNDELAELVHIWGSLQVDASDGDPTVQDQPNSIGGQAEVSVNLDGAERPTSDQRDVNYGDEDSPAVLGIMQTGTGVGAFSGTGGGGGAPNDDFYLNLREIFGTGPFFDKADDISVRTEVVADNFTPQIQAEAYWHLGYRVYEIESQRPTFGAGD